MSAPTDSKMELISKLLKLAERAGTEAEADTFMEKAEKLAATYQVDLAVARQHTASHEKRQTPVQRDIRIGVAGKLINKGLCSLFMRIASAYNVKLDIAHNNTFVIAYGFEADINLVEAMFASLAVQMSDGRNRYVRSRDWEGETYWDERTGWYKDVSARGAGQAFNAAFADRVGQRIRDRVRSTQATIIREDTSSSLSESTGTALALRHAEVEVHDFYKGTSKAKGKWQGSQATSTRASAAGREAGDHARLGGERAIGGHRAAVSA